jgi:hypothetical protein
MLPRWRADGSEIFYVDRLNNKLMAASVNTKGSVLEVGAAKVLFDFPQMDYPNIWYTGYPYDVSADGQRFLVNAAPDLVETPITVVLNWTALPRK